MNTDEGWTEWMRRGTTAAPQTYYPLNSEGGYLVVIHTHGRNGHYHPHLHLIATSGSFDGHGQRWEHLQYLP